MTHPWTLHASAALWSLRRSWPQLLRAQAAASAAAAEDGDRGTLQAWRPGGGHHGGQGGGLDTVLDPPGSRTVVYLTGLVERVRGHVEQARWLAVSALSGSALSAAFFAGTSLLDQVATALPDVQPTTARDIAAELAAADSAIRRTLRLPPNHWSLPDNPPCPSCGVRMLRAQTAAPDTAAWTVVCTAGCRCLGDGCTCGMAVRVRGVGHIWEAASPLIQAVFEPTKEFW